MRLFLHTILVMLCFLCAPSLGAAANTQKHILVLLSHDIRDPWVATVLEGIASALSRANVQLHVECLDARRHQDDRYLHDFERFLAAKYEGHRLDLAIVADNAAFDFLLRIRPEFQPRLPVVFCGVNNFSPDMIAGQDNVTGVNEAVDIPGTVNLALRLFPNVSRLVVVGGSSGIGAINLENFHKRVSAFARTVDSQELVDDPRASLAEPLADLPRNSVILRLDNLREPDGSSTPLQQSISLLSAEAPCPVFSFWDFDMGHGALGGVAVSGLAQGKKAGELALLALQGRPVGSIPVVMESPNVPMFDYVRMQLVGMEVATLPPDALVLNMPVSFYDRYRGLIWSGAVVVALMAGCIIALVIALFARRRAEKALRVSEERYRMYVDRAPAGIFIADAQGRYLDVNPEACRITGYARDELLSMAIPDLLTPDSMPLGQAHFAGLKAEGHGTGELRYRRKDGVFRWWSVFATRISEDRFLGFVNDVTGRRKAEEALKESELRFKTLHNASFGGIVIHDKGVILDCNLGLSEITGYTCEELIGMDGLLLIAERSREEVMRNILAGHEKPYQVFGVRKNREEYPVCLEARNIPYKGKLVRVTEFRDITDRKRAEEALRTREHELRMALEKLQAHIDNSPLAVIEWDQEMRISHWSPMAEKFFGWTEAEVLGRSWGDWAFIHEEDVAHVNAQVMSMVDGSEPHTVIVNRNYTKAGSVLHCKWYNSMLKDDKGEVISILSQVENFTDFVSALEAQADSEHRLRELFEHMSSGVAVYEAVDDGQDFVLLEFNAMAEKITNLPREQAIGHRLLDLFPHMDRTGFLAALRRVWLTGQDALIPPFFYQDNLRRGWRGKRP